MCYFLTGYINKEAYSKKFLDICGKFGFEFSKVYREGKTDVIDSASCEYLRVTKGCCDCDTAIGAGDESLSELRTYLDFFNKIKSIDKITKVGILKHWYRYSPATEEFEVKNTYKVDINQLSTNYLAEMLDDNIYEIQYE